MLITTEYLDAQILTEATAAVGAAGVLHSATVRLYTAGPTPNKTTPFSAYTEPTFTGYAPVTVTWTTPTRDSGARINIESQLLTFQETTTPVTVSVLGWFMADLAAANSLMAEQFDTPFQFQDLLSILKFVIEF